MHIRNIRLVQSIYYIQDVRVIMRNSWGIQKICSNYCVTYIKDNKILSSSAFFANLLLIIITDTNTRNKQLVILYINNIQLYENVILLCIPTQLFMYFYVVFSRKLKFCKIMKKGITFISLKYIIHHLTILKYS